MKGKWYINRVVNLINGKDYIGKRKHVDCDTPLEERYMGSGTLIKKAIEKYGKENFKKEILDEVIETNQEAALREIIWINYYKSKGGANYNLCHGINDKTSNKLMKSPVFKRFLEDSSNSQYYAESIEALKNILGEKGLEKFYEEMGDEDKLSWGEKISRSLKEYNANLSKEERAAISKRQSEAQLKYLKEKETKEHKERRVRKSAIGLGREYDLIDPEGNTFKVKGLSFWARETFGEEYRNIATSTLRVGLEYRGYRLILPEDYKYAQGNKVKTYTLLTPKGETIQVTNLSKFCRDVLKCKASQIEKKYIGFKILEERQAIREELEESWVMEYRKKYKDYIVEEKRNTYKPNKTYLILTPEGEEIKVNNLQQWCLNTFGVRGSYVGILTRGEYKKYKIIDKYNTSQSEVNSL